MDAIAGITSRDGVWAGGDIVTGSARGILAMGTGKIAANKMHEFLCDAPSICAVATSLV